MGLDKGVAHSLIACIPERWWQKKGLLRTFHIQGRENVYDENDGVTDDSKLTDEVV